jgi:hypothetical protein
MYLIGVITEKKILNLNYKVTSAGLITFAAGIIINEVLLAIQGFAAIYYLYLPKLNLLLFANTFTLVIGASMLFIAATKQKITTLNHYITSKKQINGNY